MKSKELINLNDLIEKYKKCKTFDPEDCFRLEKINNKLIKDFDRDVKEAENFNNIFKNMKDDDPEKLDYIFDKYNPDENEYTFTLLNEFLYYDKKKQGEFLTEIRSIFQDKEKETTVGPKKKVYGEITKYLNKLEIINKQNRKLFSK